MCACEASGLKSVARTGAGHAYLVAAPLHVIVEWLAAGRPASVGITAAVLAVDVLALHGGASDGSRRDLGQWPAAGKGGNEWICPQSQPTGGLVPTSALHRVTSTKELPSTVGRTGMSGEHAVKRPHLFTFTGA